MGDDGDVTATESTDEVTQFEHGVLPRGRRVIPQRGFSMRPERIVAAALLMTPPSCACAFLRSEPAVPSACRGGADQHVIGARDGRYGFEKTFA
jgi:hypothetical protein